MSPLREKFIRIMTLKHYSQRTQKTYVDWLYNLVKYYRRSPDLITDDEIQKYLMHLDQERKLAWSTCNQAAWAIKFFFSMFWEGVISMPMFPSEKSQKSFLYF